MAAPRIPQLEVAEAGLGDELAVGRKDKRHDEAVQSRGNQIKLNAAVAADVHACLETHALFGAGQLPVLDIHLQAVRLHQKSRADQHSAIGGEGGGKNALLGVGTEPVRVGFGHAKGPHLPASGHFPQAHDSFISREGNEFAVRRKGEGSMARGRAELVEQLTGDGVKNVQLASPPQPADALAVRGKCAPNLEQVDPLPSWTLFVRNGVFDKLPDGLAAGHVPQDEPAVGSSAQEPLAARPESNRINAVAVAFGGMNFFSGVHVPEGDQGPGRNSQGFAVG